MQTQTLLRFHVGLVTKDGRAIDQATRADARSIFAAAYPDGHTIADVGGYYAGGDEPAWIVEVYADATGKAEGKAIAVAQSVRNLLEQECVGLAIVPVQSFRLL